MTQDERLDMALEIAAENESIGRMSAEHGLDFVERAVTGGISDGDLVEWYHSMLEARAARAFVAQLEG